MVGLVIAAHGHLAKELVVTAEQIVGPLASTATCAIEPGASPEEIREEMRKAVCAVDTGGGGLVLADLFGGTPCNLGLTLTGVNLPMVLKANSLRAEALSLPELAAALARYGQKNITCASALLRESEALR